MSDDIMNDIAVVVEFDREATYKIGAVTYQVTAHYDDNGESLKDRIRRLLLDRIENAHLAQKG